METNKLLSEIASIFREEGIEKLILFGSYGWGEPNEDSDIDLLAIKEISPEDVRESRIQIKKMLWEKLGSYNISFDVILDSEDRIKERIQMGDRFYEEIYTEGKVIYA